jgi:hypothetical protein
LQLVVAVVEQMKLDQEATVVLVEAVAVMAEVTEPVLQVKEILEVHQVVVALEDPAAVRELQVEQMVE